MIEISVRYVARERGGFTVGVLIGKASHKLMMVTTLQKKEDALI